MTLLSLNRLGQLRLVYIEILHTRIKLSRLALRQVDLVELNYSRFGPLSRINIVDQNT